MAERDIEKEVMQDALLLELQVTDLATEIKGLFWAIKSMSQLLTTRSTHVYFRRNCWIDIEESSKDHLRNEDLCGVAAKRSPDALLASPLNVDLNATSPFVVTS